MGLLIYNLTPALSSDQLVQTNFVIHPNPATNFITIQLNEGLQLVKANVYATSGQLLKSGRNTVIAIEDLATGSYFLEVITSQGKLPRHLW